MKKYFILLFALIIIGGNAIAQVGINTDNSAPHSSSMLDVNSTSKGFLPPRMTTEQMNAILTPAEGLIVYNVTVNSLFWFNGTIWKQFNEPYTETDPVFTAHPASGITVGNIGNWNAAYGWGNHATAGYLTSFTETDPIFSVHPASGITAGNITNWNMAYANRIMLANGTGPLNLSISGNQLSGSINTANSATSGYLTSSDWNTFNNKQNGLTLGNATSADMTITGGNGAVIGNGMALTVNKGNLTEATSSVLAISGGTGSVLGSGVSVQVKQSGASQSGYLSNTDWNTFNNKQSTLTFGNLTSSDITVSGGTGAVKGTGAGLTINKGNLTSTDITVSGGLGSVLGAGTDLTINKGNLTESGSSVLMLTGGSAAVLGTGASIQVKQAGTSQSGYLSSGDWNSFNNKVSSQWSANGTSLFYNSGKVGLGTSNPQNKFDIAGKVVIGSTYSGTISAPANGLLVEGKVGVGTSAPVSSALAEFTSTTNGVLLPRMTRVQRNAIASPAEGLMVYCTTCGTSGSLSIFTNGSWMTFSPCAIAAPVAGSPVMSQGQIIWNWVAVSGAAGYKWNTTADYETATEMAAATSKTETGTICGTTYTRYAWAYSSCGESAMTTLTATVPAAVPAAPVAAAHVATQTSIVWNWNSVSDATGYKWNTTDDFASATEMGTATTKSETGITCGTAYTRYVWAYNGCGYSLSAALNQSTVACWACGISTMTINHVAGAVAPVTKTTTYGTVTNIPGELTKCWITSNLGSDHQATAVSDATEASAGWYWHCNRKQGYKHDGNTRTPNTTGITIISETSDWITANDPCNIELGTTWHLPTYTEWYNVDNTGGWTTWTGPWGSGLKLHAAGYLGGSDGSLSLRGSYGFYWSSTQGGATNGWYLGFGSGDSYVDGNGKAFGFSARCVRDY